MNALRTDEQRLFAGDTEVTEWQSCGQGALTPTTAHRVPIRLWASSPDRQKAASIDQDGLLKVWDLTRVKNSQRLYCALLEGVSGMKRVALNNTGDRVIVLADKELIVFAFLWNGHIELGRVPIEESVGIITDIAMDGIPVVTNNRGEKFSLKLWLHKV